MTLLESHIHSFVIKVWLEELASEGNQAVWRGRITHAASGGRRFVKELNDITHFIRPYLEEMGVRQDAE